MYKPLEMAEILRRVVSHCALKVTPYPLIRIKFRRIARKAKGLQRSMPVKELSNEPSFARHAGIPNKEHMPAEMFKKVFEKSDHLRGLDVFPAIKSRIKRHMAALWGNADSRYSGNFSPASCATQLRRLPLGRPCPDQIRDQKESALVKKNQVGAKFFGFFLYRANCIASILQSLLRCVRGRALSAFGSSIPGWSISAIHSPAYSERRISSRLTVVPCLMSRHPWSIRSAGDFVIKLLRVAASALGTAGQGGRVPALILARFSRISCALDASERRSSAMPWFCLLLAGMSFRQAGILWRAGALFPIESGFRMVSCIVL